MNEITPTDIREILSETRVWHPLGEDSRTRIVADTFGTAGVGTVSIHAACELHPDEARAFARQIEEATAWLQERDRPGLFIKGAWITDPYALPDLRPHRQDGVTNNRTSRLRQPHDGGSPTLFCDHRVWGAAPDHRRKMEP